MTDAFTAFYLIGMWYRRHEAQRRYSFFFSSTTLAGAFGGLLASAIGKMDGMRGYSGWRWIFVRTSRPDIPCYAHDSLDPRRHTDLRRLALLLLPYSKFSRRGKMASAI